MSAGTTSAVVADETVGERIRRLRRERNVTQRSLGEICPHASYAYISRVEAGERTPSVKVLREIAAALHVSVHYIETGVEDPLRDAYLLVEDLLADRRRFRKEARALRLRAREIEDRLRHGVDHDLVVAVRAAAQQAMNREEV